MSARIRRRRVRSRRCPPESRRSAPGAGHGQERRVRTIPVDAVRRALSVFGSTPPMAATGSASSTAPRISRFQRQRAPQGHRGTAAPLHLPDREPCSPAASADDPFALPPSPAAAPRQRRHPGGDRVSGPALGPMPRATCSSGPSNSAKARFAERWRCSTKTGSPSVVRQ